VTETKQVLLLNKDSSCILKVPKSCHLSTVMQKAKDLKKISIDPQSTLYN